MKILLHICCAPCACYPYPELLEQGHELTGFFYNPNIHPYTEYQRRLQAVQQWSEAVGARVIYRDEYALEEFLAKVAGQVADRCSVCYRMRLEATALTAWQQGFEAFTTTILYSIYQKHELVRQIGEDVASQSGIRFYYQDFRPGWKQGVLLSKQYNLYRQPYCGCIYSEKERYAGKG